jgi:hypothetical protein
MGKAKTVAIAVTTIAVIAGSMYQLKHSVGAVTHPPSSNAGGVVVHDVAVTGPPAVSTATGVEGSWTATFKDNSGSETAIFTIWKQADGTYAGVVSSDHPDVNRISADTVTVQGETLEIEYSQLGDKFKGTLSGANTLDGSLTTRRGEVVKGVWERVPDNGLPGPPAVTPPSREQLQKLTGVYAPNPKVRFTIELDADGLICTGLDKNPTRLIPVSATEFRVGPDPTSLVFVPGQNGVVEQLLVRKYIAGKSYDRAMRRVQ